MKVKLQVPTSVDDITVGQSQKIQELQSNTSLTESMLEDEILKVVLRNDNVNSFTAKDKKLLVGKVFLALNNEGEFKQRFELNGIEFGLIPNFDKILNSVLLDALKYCGDDENLHRFLAVIYRPIKHRDRFKNYSLVRYEGTQYNADRMKDLPLSIANGVVNFFLKSCDDLENYILRSMEEVQMKATAH